MDILARRVMESIEPGIIAIVIRETIVIAGGADLRTVRVYVNGLIIPARIDVEVDDREPRRLVREAWVLAVAGAITHPDNAIVRFAGCVSTTIGPGHVKASGAGW